MFIWVERDDEEVQINAEGHVDEIFSVVAENLDKAIAK